MVFLEETRVIWHVIGLAFLGVQTFTYAKLWESFMLWNMLGGKAFKDFGRRVIPFSFVMVVSIELKHSIRRAWQQVFFWW